MCIVTNNAFESVDNELREAFSTSCCVSIDDDRWAREIKQTCARRDRTAHRSWTRATFFLSSICDCSFLRTTLRYLAGFRACYCRDIIKSENGLHTSGKILPTHPDLEWTSHCYQVKFVHDSIDTQIKMARLKTTSTPKGSVHLHMLAQNLFKERASLILPLQSRQGSVWDCKSHLIGAA